MLIQLNSHRETVVIVKVIYVEESGTMLRLPKLFHDRKLFNAQNQKLYESTNISKIGDTTDI